MIGAMEISTFLISAIGGLIIGVIAVSIYGKIMTDKKKDEASKEADRIIHRAKSKAAKIDREAKNKAKDFENRARRNAESDIRKQKQKVQQEENNLKDKEQRLEREYKKKYELIELKEKELEEKKEKLVIGEQRIQSLEKKLDEEIGQIEKKLESVANMSSEEAKNELKYIMTEEVEKEIHGRLKEIEEAGERQFKEKSRRLMAQAIARYASEVSAERTVTTIAISGEEMKGKIIGREGRNIRALEACCGVDVVIDESPDSVIISSFDPVRREVAKRSIDRLMEDGRVHPARIEEVTDKIKSEIVSEMKDDGEKACVDLGIIGVHPAILNLIGNLKYRQTETQNLYQHSIEVSYIAGLIAAELGTDVMVARRAGLLHDIGRSIDHTSEGSHAMAGAEFAKKHGEKEKIVKAIRQHEGEEPASSLLSHIVQAANNLSKARPGARREMMESFIRRLEDLESVGNSFDGVERTFAIQSGKEVRVIVDSSKVTDEQASMLSRDISKKIMRELNYPGQIKVAVVRETRIVEHAR
ncbi:MAG: ribonuclease Y [Bdellovibrionales bacterium]